MFFSEIGPTRSKEFVRNSPPSKITLQQERNKVDATDREFVTTVIGRTF